MKKIIFYNILKIIRDIFVKACVYFTVAVLIVAAIGPLLGQSALAVEIVFMLAVGTLAAGTAAQVFKIKKIPAASRHIAFFILLYLDFILVFIAMRMVFASSNDYQITSSSTLYLSTGFIAAYLAIFGIVMGIKAFVNSKKNKKLKYDAQFKNAM